MMIILFENIINTMNAPRLIDLSNNCFVGGMIIESRWNSSHGFLLSKLSVKRMVQPLPKELSLARLKIPLHKKIFKNVT